MASRCDYRLQSVSVLVNGILPRRISLSNWSPRRDSFSYILWVCSGSICFNLDALDDQRCSDDPNRSLILDEKEEANRSIIPIGSSFIELFVWSRVKLSLWCMFPTTTISASHSNGLIYRTSRSRAVNQFYRSFNLFVIDEWFNNSSLKNRWKPSTSAKSLFTWHIRRIFSLMKRNVRSLDQSLRSTMTYKEHSLDHVYSRWIERQIETRNGRHRGQERILTDKKMVKRHWNDIEFDNHSSCVQFWFHLFIEIET